jgi:predicted metal-dependent HD superfamily phosphohydrolase
MVKGMLQVKNWETIVKRYVPDAMREALIARFSCDPVQVARHYAGEATSVIVAEKYNEQGRFYHNLKHIEACLREFHEVEANLTDSSAVLMALLFHDLVYHPEAHQLLANETASWELANQLCPLSDVVKSHILHTSHTYTGDKNADTDYVCDIDMAILGYSEQEFNNYEVNIRSEYAFADDVQYQAGRLNFLRSVLAKEHIFTTDYFHHKYETSARSNIERLIKQLAEKS